MTEALDGKIIGLPALLIAARAARQAGRTIVHCHGCFDLVHPGHIRYLRFARELGDVLVVSLTSDDTIDKGPDRPYIPQELRAENLAALAFVDWVVVDPHPTAAELLAALQPDVYVKGREYAQTDDPRFLREREIVEGYGGRVVFHSGDVIFSSSRLIRSLERDEPLDECRLRAVCDRGGIDVHSARGTLERLAGVRVVVVGDLVREHYVSCDAREAADDAPVLSLQRLGTASYWAGVAAVALQVRALGARPVIVTAVAEDQSAQAARTFLAERGIELQGLAMRREPVERTTYVADDTKLFRVGAGACQPLDSSWERHAQAMIEEQLADADVLVWCDHGYGMITPGLIRAVTPAAQRADVLIAGHAPGPWGDIRALHDTDLLCARERRVREALHDLASGLPSVTWNLLARTRGRRALVAIHKRGMIGNDGLAGEPAQPGEAPRARGAGLCRLRSEFIPSLAAHYVDLLGVEEALLSTAALTLVTGGSLAMATYLAAGAEALVAGRLGRTVLTTADLQAWIDTRPELRPQSRFLPDAATIGDIALLAPPLPLPTNGAAAPVASGG